MSIDALVDIERWLTTNLAAFATLPSGASAAELAQLERDLDRELPTALRTLLGWRGGLPLDDKKAPEIFAGDSDAFFTPLAIAEIAPTAMRLDRDLARGKFDVATYTTTFTWVKGWIPFGRHGANFMVLDLVGSFGREVGQIITAPPGGSTRTIIAPSIEAYLASYARRLAAGNVSVMKNGKLKAKTWSRDAAMPDHPVGMRVERHARAVMRPSNPLLDIVSQRLSADEIATAITNGANVGARDPSGRTPLHLAATLPTTGAAEALLAAGADADAVDRAGESPLFHAARQPQVANAVAMIRVLVAAGADRAIVANDGKTAATTNDVERVEVVTALEDNAGVSP